VAVAVALATSVLLLPRASASSTYAIAATGTDGEPVAWACGEQPVHLYGVPSAQHRRIVLDALKKLDRRTRTRFVVEGEAPRSPFDGLDAAQPVVIGFAHFDAERAAYAGWSDVARDGDRYVRGYAMANLDIGYVGDPQSTDDRDALTSVLLHELGHLVGLEHVEDDSQVMFAGWNPSLTDFGRGDRKGLRSIGCREDDDAA
jgi:hypothetical protein